MIYHCVLLCIVRAMCIVLHSGVSSSASGRYFNAVINVWGGLEVYVRSNYYYYFIKLI